MIPLRSTMAACLAALLSAPSAGAQALYVPVELGTIPGEASQGGAGLNNLGDVAGWVYVSQSLGFVYFEPGGITVLPALNGAFSSQATDVNDLGEVVGESGSRAFRWTAAGGIEGLPISGLSRANAINNRGDVAGTLNPYSVLHFHPFVLYGGVLTQISTVVGRALDINDAGQVAGYAGAIAFRHDPVTGTQYLQTPSAYPLSYGVAINRQGDVAGAMSSANGNTTHLFVYTDGGGLQDLGVLAGGGGPAGIDSRGTIVGSYGAGGGSNAFRYTPRTGIQPLVNLLPANSGWVLWSAVDINEAGQILCVGLHNFHTKAVRLDPVTRTAAVAAVGAACGGAGPIAQLWGDEPVLGSTLTFDLTAGAPGGAGVLLLNAGRPAATALGGGCSSYPSLAGLIPIAGFVLDAAGAARVPVAPVPSSPIFAGLALTTQGVLLGGGGPFGLDFTRGVLQVLGS